METIKPVIKYRNPLFYRLLSLAFLIVFLICVIGIGIPKFINERTVSRDTWFFIIFCIPLTLFTFSMWRSYFIEEDKLSIKSLWKRKTFSLQELQVMKAHYNKIIYGKYNWYFVRLSFSGRKNLNIFGMDEEIRNLLSMVLSITKDHLMREAEDQLKISEYKAHIPIKIKIYYGAFSLLLALILLFVLTSNKSPILSKMTIPISWIIIAGTLIGFIFVFIYSFKIIIECRNYRITSEGIYISPEMEIITWNKFMRINPYETTFETIDGLITDTGLKYPFNERWVDYNIGLLCFITKKLKM